MNLESLVPPLALCQLIPKGEFEDSCYVRGIMVVSLHGYGVDFLVTREELEEFKDTKFYFMTPVITSWNNSVSQKSWDQNKKNICGYTLRAPTQNKYLTYKFYRG